MDAPAAIVLVAHAAATWAMVGLIWFVQVVHYPLFALVGRDGFVPYADAHRRLTAWVVGLPMAVEGITALLLAASPPEGLGRALPLAGLAVLALVLASTVLVQVPLHGRLGAGYDPDAGRALVRSNSVRAAGWTVRGVLAAAMLVIVV